LSTAVIKIRTLINNNSTVRLDIFPEIIRFPTWFIFNKQTDSKEILTREIVLVNYP
jgi:hypothetical protein